MTRSASRLTRWGVRLNLFAGVAASVTANILHARDNPISQSIAAWPPLALLVTVELVTRVPVYRKWLNAVRITATSAIAGIAAWISYHHMVGVVARYGETGTVPYLLPLSVDGLIVVASICLIELSDPPSSAPPPASATGGQPATAAATPGTPATAMPAPARQEPQATPAAEPAVIANPEPPLSDVDGGAAPSSGPAPGDQAEPSPGDDQDQERDGGDEDQNGEDDDGDELAADLVPLLPAARTARDELIREGRTVSRDALAHRLRRNGHAIRNNRVSELLNALRREQPSPNGARPTVSA